MITICCDPPKKLLDEVLQTEVVLALYPLSYARAETRAVGVEPTTSCGNDLLRPSEKVDERYLPTECLGLSPPASIAR